MTRRLIFLTHADVVQDPKTPVPDWGLSDLGRARHDAFAASDTIGGVTAVYASTERKAREGAAPVAARLDLRVNAVAALGENDRSATGYLPPDQFQAVADAFFAQPDTAVRGWERARAAQARIAAALRTIADLDPTAGDILVVAHGGVGALWRCLLKGIEITRAEDQTGGNGGCWFSTGIGTWEAPGAWVRV